MAAPGSLDGLPADAGGMAEFAQEEGKIPAAAVAEADRAIALQEVADWA